MDHMMPGMDGVEAMKIIRTLPGYEHGGSHKIVVLTANAVDSAREMLIESGFDDFISTSASCYYDQGLFWDEVNKTVTTNPQNTPIKKWNGLGWLESWWVEIGKTVIDFPYSSEEICTNNIDNKRQQYVSPFCGIC